MTLRSSQAIIVRGYKYSESSKIIRCFTEEYGKVSVIAKGARRPKSPFGGVLEVLSHVSVIYYYRETRELQNLSKCDLIEPFLDIRNDFEKMTVGMAMMEVLDRVVIIEQPLPELFSITIQILHRLSESSRQFLNFYWAFILHVIRILGFSVHLNGCMECGTKEFPQKVPFHLGSGGVFCANCAPNEYDFTLTLESLKVLQHLQRFPESEISVVVPSTRTRRELGDLLHRYVRYHIEGFREPSALKMLKEFE